MRGYAIRRGASWRYSRVSSGGIEAKATLIPSRHGFSRLPAQPLSRRAIRASGWGGGYWGTVFEAGCLFRPLPSPSPSGATVKPSCVNNETRSVVQTCSSSSSSPTSRRTKSKHGGDRAHLDAAGNDWKKASLRLKNVSFLRFCVPLDRSRDTERAEPSAVACASDSGQCAVHALKV